MHSDVSCTVLCGSARKDFAFGSALVDVLLAGGHALHTFSNWLLLRIQVSIHGSRVPLTTTWPHRPVMFFPFPNDMAQGSIAMVEVIRLATLLFMGLTVATAGVIVVLYG